MKPVVVASFLTILTSTALMAQDVFILGEIHDNPHHHAEQARLVAEIAPAAIVFEMLTEAQAARVTPQLRGDEAALEAALGWAESGWPDFWMYYPIFAASEARIYGAAVPRAGVQRVLEHGLMEVHPGLAAMFGLDHPLPQDQQRAREELQSTAHCDALPREMLPKMVEIQRWRDAMLAGSVIQAIVETDGPVAVITGNGHARRDWGVPAYLERIDPSVEIFVLGQTEEDTALEGGFDEVISHPAVERPDPCTAF